MRRQLAMLCLGWMLAGIHPSQAYVSVVGSLDRHFELQAGQTVTTEIMVHNPGTQARHVRAYVKDFDPQPEGAGFVAAASHPRSNADWLQLMPHQQRIEAGQWGKVTVSVTLPDTWTAKGSFWSVVMIEADGSAEDLSQLALQSTEAFTLGIQHVLRTAVRVTTTHPNPEPEPAALAFVERQLIQHAEGAHLRLRLRNQGQTALRLQLHAELFDGEGQALARLEPDLSQLNLLPEAEAERRFRLAALPAGDYVMLVIADGGGEQLFGARYQLPLGQQVVP